MLFLPMLVVFTKTYRKVTLGKLTTSLSPAQPYDFLPQTLHLFGQLC